MRAALSSMMVVFTACGTPPAEAPTYHRDVAPILQEHCGSCHVPGQIAPFEFVTYEDAAPKASLIASVVRAGTMPPFLAQETDECSPPLPWVDDMRLSEADKQVLVDWAAAGAPEGDPAHAVEPPTPPSLSLTSPDFTLTVDADYAVPAGTTDDFVCFVLDPEIDDPAWIQAIQLTPSNTAVAHHALVFQDVSGNARTLAGDQGYFPCFNNPDVSGFLMYTWTPGATPFETPATSAMPLDPDATIVVQMHYHPDLMVDHVDRPTIEMVTFDGEPTWAAAQALIGNDDRLRSNGTGLLPDATSAAELAGEAEPEFLIPAGADHHVETMLYTQDIPIAFPVFAVGTHMHYLGTDMKIDFVPAGHDVSDPEAGQCLIQTPVWDFNWQRTFSYDAPIAELPTVGPGDSLRLRCTYDNSTTNGAVVSALAEQGLDQPIDVPLGEETLDEMCLALVGILVPPELISELY